MAVPLLDEVSMRLDCERGFSLTDMLMTVSVIGVIAAMAVPLSSDLTAEIKATEAARLVERELQDARLRAVGSNRILRVRLNCPNAGYVRTVEYLNSTADTSANRCSPQTYPYPAADDDVLTRPNYDGPVRALPTDAEVGSHVIEFLPDGTARTVVSNVATNITTPISITISRNHRSRAITINAAGKVQLQ